MKMEGALKTMVDRAFADVPKEFLSRVPKADVVYGIAPSASCPSGTRGRVGVFEFLPTTKALEKVILEHPVEDELLKVARSGGMFTMREDAIIKMLHGDVPFEEINTLGGDVLNEEAVATA
jgi:type II secretory ATPase GspE/PulE/Tfp pilus assembly ATPase PilB-like protein